MDASISASLGAMGPLIGKLDMLLGEASEDDAGDPFHRLRLRLGFKDGVALVHLLREDLEEISTNLENLSEVEDPPLTAKCWMKEVRELSYDIEDYIDSFVRPARNSNITTRPGSRSSSISKISHVELARLPKKKLAYKRVSNNISDFIIRAHDAKKRYKRYELNWQNLRHRYVPVGPILPTPYQESTDLMIDGQMSELISTLANDGDHQLKVVSIVGSGGIGKTTLVRALYNKIRGRFQLRAFIQMTRKPDVKTVLRQMLTQVQRQQSHDHCEDLDLISKIRKQLQNKRYLIVVDDLWSPSEWNIIYHAFPEGSQCSRIIVTTQIEDVALTCCSYHSGFVHEMRPQDSYSSRKLFFTKVFGSECESDCPDTFKEASNKIIELCGGLPLATFSMASLLSSYPVVLIEQWAYISDSLSSNLRTCPTTEVVRQVLNFSYNNLTHHLKTCLLYLNMYPERYTICKDDLVKQWVAEGFIGAAEGRDMERVARNYFDELIDRRFLQPACMKHNNAMVSCIVHDTVHDLIAYKSVEENFVMVVNSYRKNVELCDKVHRLSLQFDDTKHAKKPADIRSSQVRSLFFFGLFRCMPSITEFKLLRVLNLQLSGHHGDDVFDLSGISELFLLRYLKVASDVCIELPKHMQGLQYLETLDVDAELAAVPWDIIHLPCLLHLQLPFETNLMDWIGSMRFNSVQKLGKLTNLRDLHLTCSTTPPLDHLKQNMEALGSLLAGLGNLNRLTLVCGSFHTNAVVGSPSNVTISWDGFASPLLQRFEWSTIRCTFSRVPKWTGQLENLRVLKITVKELLRDGVDILKGLPALTTLSIYVLAEPVASTIFDKAGFSVLKYFKYRCSAPWLKFEAGAMPNLWKLKLGFNAHRVDLHDSTRISISHLPGLQEISVKMGGAGDWSYLALAAAIINHPSNPQINMQLVDWIFYGDKVTEKKAHGDKVVDPLHSAATRIQNKFRGWRARKEFILIRQRTVKIQAHVRGHQVRKHYRKIVRSVGFVEKFILRWRRKPSGLRGSGLRGFRPAEGSVDGSSGGTSSSSIQDKPSRDDGGFLQGRKQAEERLQKAIAGVRSLVQYPEARGKYQRLLQESQVLSVPPVRTASAVDDDAMAPEVEGGGVSVSCSVASDRSRVTGADVEGAGLGFFGAEGGPMVLEDSAASVATAEAKARVAAGGRGLFTVDCMPLWGYTSICGRQAEMEDAVAIVPRFFDVPPWMLTGNAMVDGLDPKFRLPAYFFGVYDGYGGAQVANYCRERLHVALLEQLSRIEETVCVTNLGDMEFKKQWEKAFVDSFARVDDEVGGKAIRGGGGKAGTSDLLLAPEPVAPETVGSTAVVAVICSSHIIVSNCGDSRAVLCRGKQPVPLSVDHKPNREDERARIEAKGGRLINWGGYKVMGILAMSRSIGHRYLKPFIIPVPEVTIVPRDKDDECLILASEGLWDVMSNEVVCEAARKRILLWHKNNGTSSTSAPRVGDSADPAAQAAAEFLSKLALRKGSKDNITVVVVDLKAQRNFKSKTSQKKKLQEQNLTMMA